MFNLNQTWLPYLENEFEKDYMKDIKVFLEEEIKAWKTIYPQQENIFNAFNTTHFDDVKVVILWQDPYHGTWQAHGLSFSVLPWVKLPPSLRNIYKEIENDTCDKQPLNWDLTRWASQWVLLLNSILTVGASMPASHSKIGWERFTDEVIKIISDKKENIVFVLWWAFAQSKESLIDKSKHFVLSWPHPSPFSAYRWFFWCKHFSKTNEILEKLWKDRIVW